MTLVIHLLHERALERDLRASTVRSYETLLRRIGLLDREVETVTREEALEAVWRLGSVNTRRSTVIALKSVFGWPLKVPRGVPKRFTMESADTLRLALMQSPHELRGLCMMLGGLRCGEACSITWRDVQGDRLLVTKQVCEGTNVIGPVKSTESSVIIPWWLAERLSTLEGTAKPASVRESFRRAGRKVGIQLSPHMLRKWHISTLIEAGVALEQVRIQARHSSIQTTLVHYQAFDQQAIHNVFG